MLRRSVSSSHIPIPKTENSARRSKSITRVSRETKEVGGNSSVKKRAGSIDKLPLFKKSNSFVRQSNSLATPGIGSRRDYSLKRSLGTTPTSSLATPTPLSSRSRSRSPYKKGSQKASTDKKWIGQQFEKVKTFLQIHPKCSGGVPEPLKPPTINSFVQVMSLLFQEINPRIELNTTNYKEVVMNYLKMLEYPGNISVSLLKAVNTQYNWIQIVCIWAWLVDAITFIKSSEVPSYSSERPAVKDQLNEQALTYIFKRYSLFNTDEDEDAENNEFIPNYAEILGVRIEETKHLQQEVQQISQLKDRKAERIEETQKQITINKQELENLQIDIDSFYDNKHENLEHFKCSMSALESQKNKLEELIKQKADTVESLKKTIKNQPFTVEDKNRLLRHIHELEQTFELKKERFKVKKHIKETYDNRFFEAKKKVKCEVYRLNNQLMEIAFNHQQLNSLKLEENDFLASEFEDAVKMLPEKIQIFQKTLNTEIGNMKKLLIDIENEQVSAQEEIESLNKEFCKLCNLGLATQQQIDEFNKNLAMMKAAEMEKQKAFSLEMEKMNKAKSGENVALQKLAEIKKEKIEQEHQLESKLEQWVNFFISLRQSLMTDLLHMNEIREDVTEHLQKCLEKVFQIQKEILQDLQSLDNIKM